MSSTSKTPCGWLVGLALFAVAAMGAGVMGGRVLAQGAPSKAQGTPAAVGQPGNSATSGAAGTPQKKATGTKGQSQPSASPAGTGGGGSSEAGLRQRVESLEEQLVDLQVVIGTLESLSRSAGATGASAAAAPVWRSSGASAGESARLEGLETQIRALTAQVEQLSAQVRQGGGATAAGAAAAAGRRTTDVAGYRTTDGGSASSGSASAGFGSTTVSPGGTEADPIGGLISGQAKGQPAGQAANASPGQTEATRQSVATAPLGAANDPGAKQLYETAYGFLLQQDYGAAEAAFDDFMKRYPADPLAGNAQYWLGESHYVRGQYKAAAGAFLKGYQSFGKSAKAPDSLLKLAMSLDRLGQKDAACSSYGELTVKFPNAPAHVKSRAQSERQRIGCS